MDSLNALTARRKADREKIAAALEAIASKHGAIAKRSTFHLHGLDLNISCNGVGAMICVDSIHGGAWTLIHWFNAGTPTRDFSGAFNVAVESGGNGRPHHKATSHPRDWDRLAMMLDQGLLLAARGKAFEPSAT